MAAAGASSISVTVRVRPFTIREAAQVTRNDDQTLFLGDGSLAGVPAPKIHKGIRPVIKVMDEKCLIFDPPEDSAIHRFGRSTTGPQGKRAKDQTFAFDRVFDDTTSQSDVYEATTKPLLDSVLEGYNATVFAYGATGCGKTHTITGTSQQPGIIFLTMQELFEKIQEIQDEKVTEITLSYLEIYNETIRDLLVEGGSKQPLMLREDANQAVSVAGLSSHRPQNVQEVMDMIVRGNEYRTMSPTEANATSSRSHAVLQINVSSKDRNASVNEPHTMATLSIIDLAGSERASATKNRGERLTEGANINKSLLALGSCINALCDPRKRNHIPYRNSKLTRLLKFSLGGNCRTVMIVCVSPSSAHYDETQNTLRYANRAKNIQTKVTKNVYNVNRHVKDYLVKIDEQRHLIEELMKKQKDFEGSAFIKYQKQSEKKDGILRDAIVRLRQAFADSEPERRERLNMSKTLKQAEKRISLISSWIAAFDNVKDIRENEEMPSQVAAMRDTAVGISAELEQTRQHCHRRLERTNWTSKMDTALQVGLRGLAEVDGNADGRDAANLTREYELLKSNADRELFHTLLDLERGGDAAIVQALIQAHIETVAILSQITQMDEADAVAAARKLLTKIMNSCTNATSQAIRPDGGLPVTAFAESSYKGTPKRKKPVNIMEPSPMRPIAMPSLAVPSLADASHLTASPAKASPRRKKLMSGVKKGIQFSPMKKKSPTKIKRGVRWRDDTENGTLAEFQKTPEPIQGTPTAASIDLPQPNFTAPAPAPRPDGSGSSPIPTPPKVSVDLKGSSRFAVGALSKRSEGSPNSRIPSPYASDSEGASPLREIGSNSRSSGLSYVQSASSDAAAEADGGNSSSEGEKWTASDARKISHAIRRRSSTNAGSVPISRAHRRRSPTAATIGSPPNENSLLSVGAARRMVKSNHDGDWKHSVLSPRVTPIMKGAVRRTTVANADDRPREAPVTLSSRAPVRITSGSAARGSLMPNSKGVWR